jgi:hypothetical protein
LLVLAFRDRGYALAQCAFLKLVTQFLWPAVLYLLSGVLPLLKLKKYKRCFFAGSFRFQNNVTCAFSALSSSQHGVCGSFTQPV